MGLACEPFDVVEDVQLGRVGPLDSLGPILQAEIAQDLIHIQRRESFGSAERTIARVHDTGHQIPDGLCHSCS